MGKITTVADLVAKLQTFDQNLPVGNVGHFGEFYPLDMDNVYPSKGNVDATGKATYWREINRIGVNTEVIAIIMEDIGEEPD